MSYKGRKMVVGDGFEPSKHSAADLQSAPFGRSGIPPRHEVIKKESNLYETSH